MTLGRKLSPNDGEIMRKFISCFCIFFFFYSNCHENFYCAGAWDVREQGWCDKSVWSLLLIAGSTCSRLSVQPATSDKKKYSNFCFFSVITSYTTLHSMATHSTKTVLIIGHSYICWLTDYCSTHQLVNFGLPLHFQAAAFSHSAASLTDLPAIFLCHYWQVSIHHYFLF